MLNNLHFYNRSIRKIVVAFGTIFNDIQIVRYTKDGVTPKEVFKVPLSYGSKEKYLTRITSDPSLTKSVNTVVPRISFELTGMSYDVERKRNSIIQNMNLGPNNSVITQYNPIPYNFDFSMSIYVRNTEDGTQIIEQILPFFTPDFTVSVDFISELQQKYDLPILLNTVDNETTYEGDFMDTRLIIWNLNFTAKGYIWPPVKVAANGLITGVNSNVTFISTNISGVPQLNRQILNRSFLNEQSITVDYANGSNYFRESEVVRTSKNKFGTVTYFSNNSIGTLVLRNLNDIIEVGEELVGDISHAKYVVTETQFNQDNNTITIRVVPDPIDASPDDEYGFSETIIEP
jgi:hypothetical protein